MTNNIEQESQILKYLSRNELSHEDLSSISYILGLILTRVFSNTEKETGQRDWSIDDMSVYTHSESDDKLTLRGKVHWFSGGGKCISYQADIAKNTNPLLYSYKLKDKHNKQILYIEKNPYGWTIR